MERSLSEQRGRALPGPISEARFKGLPRGAAALQRRWWKVTSRWLRARAHEAAARKRTKRACMMRMHDKLRMRATDDDTEDSPSGAPGRFVVAAACSRTVVRNLLVVRACGHATLRCLYKAVGIVTSLGHRYCDLQEDAVKDSAAGHPSGNAVIGRQVVVLEPRQSASTAPPQCDERCLASWTFEFMSRRCNGLRRAFLTVGQ